MQESTLTHITSPAERERRHAALADAMTAAGHDALVIWSRGDEFLRGRVQYVSDIYQWAGWGIVVLPAKGEATFVGDPLWSAARAEAVEWIPHVVQSQAPGEEVAGVLADLGLARGSIGLVGLPDAAPAAHVRALEAAAPGAAFADATDLFDDVRAIKSDEEIGNLRETSRILLAVFDALAAEIRPGVPEWDVTAEGHRLCRQYGCLDGIVQIGRPPFRYFSHGSDAAIARDDVVVIDLEWGGPTGYWLELRRCFSFGPPTDEARRFFELRREAYDACVEAMRPGAHSTDVLRARDAVYDRHGYPRPTAPRYTAHGIGIDSLEPPWVPGKDRVLAEGMVLSLHPDIVVEDPALRARVGGITLSDNILVTADGPERMTDDEVPWVVVNC
ncbi:MAG TPA: M24 family metallopeptidase [Solirubrobacteraceae bacterium]|nr:M24 family metallopeptidase [Solirubrobacteraceae bacterium]